MGVWGQLGFSGGDTGVMGSRDHRVNRVVESRR